LRRFFLLFMNALLAAAPRFLFFTGKGGVGKTSMACATAVTLADAGKRVLLISTDPASNLDEVLGTPLGQSARPVAGVPRLDALNIDPGAAALAYRERIVEPFRGVLPEAAVKSIEEQLSGACTVEIASFNEFTGIIGNEKEIAGYDHVVLDTAPTGHTLRLLSLPAAWNDFIAENKTGGSCLGPLAGLKDQRLIYEKAVSTLNDSGQTLLVLVTRAETASLREASRASEELAGLGIRNQRLIINGTFEATDREDAVALAFEEKGQAALARIPEILVALPATKIPFNPQGFVGIEALRAVFKAASDAGMICRGGLLSAACRKPNARSAQKTKLEAAGNRPPLQLVGNAQDFGALVDRLAQSGRGVIMTMGKGGVGKTTLAAAVAVELARHGFPVHLSTTDPAAHVSDAIGGSLPNLTVSRIDPAVETRAHVEQVLATAGAQLDAEGRNLLEEELRSPCTEEVAVFQAFARMVAQGKDRFVVLDTAPTGHTLLLLDATEAYHREVLRSSSEIPGAVRELLPRLRDPDYTKILLVTLPEPTPVHEAAQLQDDLRRAEIEPYAWVINQSFAAAASADPALRARANREIPCIGEVTQHLGKTVALIPWMAGEFSGAASLQRLIGAESPVTVASL
jgi:arsenite-transporting ATPase